MGNEESTNLNSDVFPNATGIYSEAEKASQESTEKEIEDIIAEQNYLTNRSFEITDEMRQNLYIDYPYLELLEKIHEISTKIQEGQIQPDEIDFSYLSKTVNTLEKSPVVKEIIPNLDDLIEKLQNENKLKREKYEAIKKENEQLKLNLKMLEDKILVL